MSLAAMTALLLALAPRALHPLSMSSSRLEVDGRQVHVLLRCHASTLNEAVPVDRNGDGMLEAEELTRAGGEIEAYVLERYVLTTNAARWGHGAPGNVAPNNLDSGSVAPEVETGRTPLVGRLVGVRSISGDQGSPPAPNPRESADPAASAPLVEMQLEFESADALADLRIECALFRESDPWHRHQAEIVWNGSARESRLLWIEDPRWTFMPEAAAPTSAVAQYIRLGIDHILTGYDHIAFLVALIVASRRFRSLLAVVTAFTIAHSLSLACAATGLVEVSPRIVEPLIALSIAYVGCRNLFDRAQRRIWIEAFAFGLVHGLGFAGSIAETLAAEKQKLWALFGFNLGVELGQLAIVIALVTVLRLVPKRVEPQDGAHLHERLAPRWILLPTSAVVALLGVFWFIARTSAV